MRILEKEKKNTKKEGIKTHKHQLAKTLKTYTECGFVTVEGRSREGFVLQPPPPHLGLIFTAKTGIVPPQ